MERLVRRKGKEIRRERGGQQKTQQVESFPETWGVGWGDEPRDHSWHTSLRVGSRVWQYLSEEILPVTLCTGSGPCSPPLPGPVLGIQQKADGRTGASPGPPAGAAEWPEGSTRERKMLPAWAWA